MKVGSLEIEILANLARLRTDMEKANSIVGDSAKRINRAIDSIGTAMAGLGGALSVAALVGFARGAIEAADELNKLSQRTGVAVEQLSQLRYAAGLADVSHESLNTAIKKLNVSVAEGIAGDKQRLAQFKAVGVTQETLKKGTVETMFAIADAYSKAKDGAGKVENAVKLMGKAGDEMIPFLNGGRDSIIEMMEQANKLGLTISSDFAAQAEEFNDNLTRIHKSSEAAAIVLGENLVKSLGLAIEKMAQATVEGGKLQGIIAFVQTFLTGDDRHKANVEVVEATNRILEIQNAMDKINAKGAEKTAQDEATLRALRAELPLQQQKFETARNYGRMMDEQADKAKAAADAAKQARTSGNDIATENVAAVEAYEKMIAKIKERIDLAKAEADQSHKLTDEEKFAIKFKEDLKAAHLALSPAQQVTVDKLLAESAALFQANENRAKKIKMMQAESEAAIQFEEETGAALAAESKERERVSLSITESVAALDEQDKMLAAERASLGMGAKQRDAYLEKLRIQLKLEKDLWDLNHNTSFDASQRAAEADRLKSAAERAKAQADEKAAIQTNIEMIDSMEGVAHKTWTSIREDGQHAFEKIGDTIKSAIWDMLYQLTVKRWVISVGAQLFGSPGAAAAAQMMGGGALGGGGGIGGMANSAQSAYSLYNNGSSIYTVGSQYAAGTMSAANAAGTVYANAAGTGLDGLLATNGAYGTAATTTGTAAAAGAEGAGATGALGAMGPWGWAALAAIAIASYVGGRGEQRFGGQYNGANLVGAPSGGPLNGNLGPQSIQGTQDSINSALKAMGSSQQLQGLVSGYESSGEGMGFAYAGGTLSGGAQFGQGLDGMGYMNRRGSKSAEQAFSEFTEELKQSTLEALQAADIKGKLAEYIKGLGNIESLTTDALNQAYNRVATALAQRAQLQAKLDEMDADPLEQLAKAREAERKQIDETNQDLLDQIYARQDLARAGQELVTAFQAEVAQRQQAIAALNESAGKLRDFAKDIRDFLRELATSALSPNSMFGRTASASQDYASTLAAARAGNADARGRLTNSAQTYLTQLQGSASSSVEYQIAYARVAAELALEATGADAKASELEAQAAREQQAIDLQQKQLEQLGLIQNNTLTFAQAMDRYNAAKAAVDSAASASAAAAAVVPADNSAILAKQEADARAYLANNVNWAAALGWGGGDPTSGSGYAVGTDFVPFDMITKVHKGERIVPAEDNPYANPYTSDGASGHAVVDELAALREEMRSMTEAAQAMSLHLYKTRVAVENLDDRGVQVLPAKTGEPIKTTA